MFKFTIVASIVALCQSVLVLQKLDYLRLPNRAGNYVINSNTAKESAYDDLRSMLYVIGKETAMLYAIDVNDPTNTFIHVTHLFDVTSDGRPLDVELCRSGNANLLAISFDSQISSTNDGHVVFYNLFDRSNGETLTPVSPNDPYVPVGPHPDNIKFSSDCRRLIVANEGEPRVESGVFVDPAGTVNKLDINVDDVTQTPAVDEIRFEGFNSGASLDDLLAKGVRYWLRRNPVDNSIISFAQTVEPEYVAISPNNGYAYVTLQENNAMAKINLELDLIETIISFGNKSFDVQDVDANDRDGIRRIYRRVKSFYQPDKVTFLQWEGVNYLLTADEGKPSSLASAGYTDYGRANTLGDWNVDPSLESELTNNNELGRAVMSSVDGLEGGQRVEPLMFGGRGFSVHNAETFERVFESGAELERYSAEHFPDTFNGDCCIGSQTPSQQADQRSAWMGPEISAIAVGNFQTQTVIILGSGRNGLLYVYRILPGGSTPSPEFQSVHRAGSISGTWTNLYNQEMMGDAKISDIKFTNQPNPMVMVTSLASGSVSFYGIADAQWP